MAFFAVFVGSLCNIRVAFVPVAGMSKDVPERTNERKRRSFLELYFEQKSIMRECRLRRPAAAFHARLKRFYTAYFGTKEGGAA